MAKLITPVCGFLWDTFKEEKPVADIPAGQLCQRCLGPMEAS
jgi:hypothetical protein